PPSGMSRRSRSLALFGLIGVVGALASVPGGSAAPPPTWGKAIKVPGMAVVGSISCATSGNCAAGGSGGSGQVGVVDQTNGSWGSAIQVAGTAALNSGGGAWLESVSCASAGNCAAGGSYTDGSGHYQAFVADETNGTWGTAIEVPGTATLNSGGQADLRSVS